MTVIGPAGSDTEIKTDYSTVFHLAPVADFTGNPITGLSPLTVNFTDLSKETIISWEWDFGDGTASTAQNPNHIYSSSGSYPVSLNFDGPGGSDQETKIGYIRVACTGADLDNDNNIDLSDAILALQVMGKSKPVSYAYKVTDVMETVKWELMGLFMC